MNNNIIKYCILTFLASIPMFAVAQEKVVSQNVNVEKDFIPEIKKANKLLFRPQQEQPAFIDFSNINYNILYRSEPYSPVVNPLSMPTYERASYSDLYNGYASLMIGVPLQSKVSLYYATAAARDLVLGAGFNNRGYYNKLKNDYGDNISALDMKNELSLMLKYRVSKLEVNFDLLASHQLLNRYGYANPQGFTMTADQYAVAKGNQKQSFFRGSANISIGTPEDNKSLFNGRFRGFYSAIEDKYGYSEQITHAGLSASTRKLNDIHRFFLDVEYIAVSSDGTIEQTAPVILPSQELGIYDNIANKKSLPYSTLFVYPKYTLSYKKLDLEVGAKMTLNIGNGWYNDKRHAINPVAKVQVNFLDNALIPYISLDGEYQYNTYYNMSAINPFVSNGLTAPNTNTNNLVFGFKGNLKSKVQYNAFVGYEMNDNKVMFVNNGYGNTFTTAVADMNALIAGASIRYDISRSLYVHGEWRYGRYEKLTNKETGVTDNFAYGIPAHKASIKVGYDHIGGKFGAFAKANIQSKREGIAIFQYYSNIIQFNEIATKADVSLGGYYKLNKRLAFDVEINNILNSKLYEYNFYRGIGFNALIGVSYLF